MTYVLDNGNVQRDFISRSATTADIKGQGICTAIERFMGSAEVHRGSVLDAEVMPRSPFCNGIQSKTLGGCEVHTPRAISFQDLRSRAL